MVNPPSSANEPREEITPHGARSFQIKPPEILLLLDPERGIINVGNISDRNSVYVM